MSTQSGRTESDIRVRTVLAGMTLVEKVAQLSCGGRAYEMADLVDHEGVLDVEAFIARFPHGVGQIGRLNVDRGSCATSTWRPSLRSSTPESPP